MSALFEQLPVQFRRLWRRSLWALMLVAHIPAIVKVLGAGFSSSASSIEPASALGLLFATALFILKIIDVRWLRFKTDRRSLCALVLAVVLLHVNAFMPDWELVVAEPPTVLIANLLLVGSMSGCHRALKRLAHAADVHHSEACKAAIYSLAATQAFLRLTPQRICLDHIPPRAPPRRNL